MNQLMTIDVADLVGRLPSRAAFRRCHNSLAEARREEVAISATRRLRSCHNFELRRLQCEVEVEERILIISGNVSSFYLKQLAQETVRSLAGIDRIVNQVEVSHHRSNN